MDDALLGRHGGRSRRLAACTLVVVTVAAGAALGWPHPAAAWSIIAPVLPRSGSSDGYEISTVQVGVQAQAIAIDPGTHSVFVASNELLTIVDEKTGAVSGSVPLPGSAVALAVDTTTHRVYALEQFPQLQPPGTPTPKAVPASIAVIDPTLLSVITTYPNAGYGPAFPSTGNTLVDDPIGHRLFSASVNVSLGGHEVVGATQIDTVTGAVTAVSGGYQPNSLAYDPSTEKLYAADQGQNSVTVLSVQGAPRDITSAELAGSQPDGIAVDPSTQTVYIANNGGASVSVLDARTDKVVTTIRAGAILAGVGIDTSNNTVFAANGADGNVTVIDGTTNRVTGTIQIGAPQYEVAVDPTTHSIWTTSSLGTSVTALNPIVPRFAGADRFATAAAISANEYQDNLASAVVLARGNNFPDALVGAPLAAAKNAPLLFTSGITLPATTEAEIRRVLVRGKTVYLLGGPNAIPNQIVAQLTALGYSAVRIAGVDRFETAVAVADELGDPSTIFLASGSDFADALTAGPAATQAHGAILLTSPGGIESSTFNYLGAHSATVYAIGGPAATADPTATPLFGADRFATGIAVAQQFFPAAAVAGIASGGAFPDALAAGAYMAASGGPLLLTQPSMLSASVATYLAGTKATITSTAVFGGSAALAPAVQTSAQAALGP